MCISSSVSHSLRGARAGADAVAVRTLAISIVVILAALPALAQDIGDDPFTDLHDGGKLHIASGFICPAKIGLFERDAAGEADPETGEGFCAYSALDGVYGTITLKELDEPYNAKTSLAPGFIEQEDTGGRRITEGVQMISMKPHAAPLAVYTRTYETAKLEDLHYRILFAGAQFKNWAVEATIEYADPRDLSVESEFLRAVYAAADSEIAGKENTADLAKATSAR